jgi:hypothetical protein
MNLRKLAGAGLGALFDPVLLGLVALAMIGSAFFLAHELGKTRVERDAAREVAKKLTIWADRTCEAVSVAFRPDGETDVDKWGQGCLAAVRSIRGQRDAMKEASEQAALDAIAEQQRKTSADVLAARKADATRRTAIRHMEAANAQVSNDEVGGDWFARLNELGGLRPWTPHTVPTGQGNGADGSGEGSPAGGLGDLPRGS